MILGIDVGSCKIGYAILDDKYNVFSKGIILLNDFKKEFLKFIKSYEIEVVAVGSGTGHKKVMELIDELNLDLKVVIISERNTSVQAKWRYINSLKGFKGFFCKFFGYLDKPVDDISAVIIAERYLNEKRKKSET
ncbi:RNase H-fold protein, predicted Holliday junction resolvase [Thermodesulfobium acidiphilum]|uniref:RNase H-fold protein, predicted Holliday junction resolvase n=1 Tax=Thermodesulfobium acidiphilum TaxID=1794699 RepID=A0A2R4VZT3_THEAF|nr:Holliday junction resolvase RuvX [Thermodesulfobium acidiphilum]AWB09928.1 RNase H-fold protein, predicted Holliday junction resolvase [Thermodesulfobium acidiphilum]